MSRINIPVYLGLALITLIWGTQFLIIKVGQETIPPLLTVFFRFLILAVVGQVSIFNAGAKAPRELFFSRLAFGSFQALAFGLLYWSEQHISSATAGMIFSTSPVFVAVFAHLLVPDDKLTLNNLTPLSVGLLGVFLIAKPSVFSFGGTESIAILAVLVAAMSAALNKVFSKKLASEVPVSVLIRDLGVIVALFSGCGWFIFERHLPTVFTARAVVSFFYLGCVASAAANMIFLLILRRRSITAMSYLQFATALVALLTGVLIGKERITPTSLTGAAVILSGLLILASQKPRFTTPRRESSAAIS